MKLLFCSRMMFDAEDPIRPCTCIKQELSRWEGLFHLIFLFQPLRSRACFGYTRFFATVTGANGFIFRKIIAWVELSWFGGVNNCFHDTRSSPSPGFESSREQDRHWNLGMV